MKVPDGNHIVANEKNKFDDYFGHDYIYYVHCDRVRRFRTEAISHY